MVSRKGERFFFSFLFILLIGALIAMGSLVTRSHSEHLHFKEREQQMQANLARLQERLDAQSEYLNRLMTDDIFLEQVVRQRLGFVAPNEVVFRFETPAQPRR
jgi:cell division protein FtsB